MATRRKKVSKVEESANPFDESTVYDEEEFFDSLTPQSEEILDQIPSGWSGDYIEAAGKLEGWGRAEEVLDEIVSVRTVFPDFNRATHVGGIPVRRVHTIHGPTHGGKGIALRSFVILTPSGWKYVRDMSIGDPVIGRDGKTYSLTGIYPRGVQQLYRVTFSDGVTVDCDSEHLWFTTTRKERNRGRYVRGQRPERLRIPTGIDGVGSVKGILDIMSGAPREHAIPTVLPVIFDKAKDLPIHPYVLGVMLGDGSFVSGSTPSLCNPEMDLCEKFSHLLPKSDSLQDTDKLEKYIRGGSLAIALKDLKLFGCHSWDKFIPNRYLRSTVENRIELLRGLFDTDGSVHSHGTRIEYSTSSKQLAEDVLDLIRGLGGIASCQWRTSTYTYEGEKKIGRDSARIFAWFDNGICPVSSKKHLLRWKPEEERRNRHHRTILSVEPIDCDVSCCISVDSPDNLFVTTGYVVTHNTAFVLGLVKSFVDVGYLGGFVDAEFSLGKEFGEEIVCDLRKKPNFLAVRPENYEETIEKVDTFLVRAGKVREKFPEAKSILVVDSINKLVPKRELAKFLKEGQINEKGAVELTKGHHGRYRAALNQAWLDHLTPLVARADCALILIAQERDDQDTTDFFKQEFKVKGGAALLFDASLVIRVMKSSPVFIKPSDEKKNENICGFGHRVRIWKSKVSHMEGRYTDCIFHLSNGRLTPKGLDMARDAMVVAIKLGVLAQSGAWYSYRGRRTQGFNNMLLRLVERPSLLQELLLDVNLEMDREAGRI